MERTGKNRMLSGSFDGNARRIGGENELLAYTVMTLAVILCSLPLPLASVGSRMVSGVAGAVFLACAGLTVFTSRRFFSAIIVLISLSFVAFYLKDATPVAAIFGAVIASGLYSAAIGAAKRIHIPFLICAPALSALATYLITSNLPLTLLSVAHLIPALAMGLGARRKLSRTYTVAIYASVFAVEIASFALAHTYLENGALSPEIIDSGAEYLRITIEQTFTDAIRSVGVAELDAALLLQIKETSASIVNLLPGLIGVAALALGYFVQRIESALFESFEREELYNVSSQPISVSLTSAILFTVAHVFSYTSSPSSAPSFLAIASANVSLILLPFLLCIGLRVMAGLPKRIGFLALVTWIGAVIVANMLSESILTVLALIGAFYIVFVRTDSWAKDHYSKGEDQ